MEIERSHNVISRNIILYFPYCRKTAPFLHADRRISENANLPSEANVSRLLCSKAEAASRETPSGLIQTVVDDTQPQLHASAVIRGRTIAIILKIPILKSSISTPIPAFLPIVVMSRLQ